MIRVSFKPGLRGTAVCSCYSYWKLSIPWNYTMVKDKVCFKQIICSWLNVLMERFTKLLQGNSETEVLFVSLGGESLWWATSMVEVWHVQPAVHPFWTVLLCCLTAFSKTFIDGCWSIDWFILLNVLWVKKGNSLRIPSFSLKH